MQEEGWAKLHRKLLDSTVFENEKMLKFWIWCLLKATHKEHVQRVGLQEIQLKKGQFVFGRKKSAQELNMTESYVYKLLKQFEKEQLIELDSNNKFTIVSVVNWGIYQEIPSNIEQESSSKITTEEQQSNNKVTTKEQQSNTNKNVKNDKNVKNKDIGVRFTPPSLQQVQTYCTERNNKVDAEKFIDFYTAKGWMVGKNKMKDWKASIRTWEKGDKDKPVAQQAVSKNKFNNFHQREYDFEKLERDLLNSK